MENESVLVLSGHFEFHGKKSFYVVQFLKDLFIIKEDDTINEINYTDIEKIRYSSTTLKITLKTGVKIKMPCNSIDLKRIKTLFNITESPEPIMIKASALVNIGDSCFFVPIKSTNIKDFKIRILQRIAKQIYPACEAEGILLEMFSKFNFVVIGEELEVELHLSNDLEAALIYFDNKLRIMLKTK